MSKEIIAEASSTSYLIDRAAIGGTITEGLAGTVGRHVKMKVAAWHIVNLLGHMVEDDPVAVAATIRQSFPIKSWRAPTKSERIMHDIAELIDPAPPRALPGQATS